MSGFGRRSITLKVILLSFIVFLMMVPSIQAQSSRSESDFIYAKRLYDDGLFDLAAEALENYLATYTDSPHRAEASLLIGEARWNEKNFEAARTAFQSVAMNFPNDPRALTALFRVADCYNALGDRDKNIRALLRIPVFYPGAVEAPVALINAARLLIEEKRWADAEAPLQQVIQQYIHAPQVIDARMMWAKVLAHRGDLESAIDEANRVAGQADDAKLAIEALGLQGEWYSQLGRDAEAEASWQKILTEYPSEKGNASALIRMADRRLKIGDARKAELLYRQALESELDSEHNIEANLGLGDALFILKRYEASLAFYEKVNVKSDKIDFRKALAYEYNDQLNEALVTYREIVKTSQIKPIVAASKWRSAVILEKTGRFKEAATLFKDAELEYANSSFASEAAYKRLLNLNKIKDSGLGKEADDFIELYPKSSKIDDIAWLKICKMLEDEDYKESLAELERFVVTYPMSPYLTVAKEKINYINTYIQIEGDPASKVAGLLAEVAGGLDKNLMAKKLGEIYLNDFKDYKSAQQQFKIVLEDTTTADNVIKEVNILYAKALWLGFKYKYSELNSSPEKVREANRISGELIDILYNINDPGIRADIAYYIIQLGLESRSDRTDKIRYQREFWQDYLADYPSSKHNPEILFDLAEAFSIELEDDTLMAGDDPAIWYLGTIVNEYPESEFVNRSYLRLSDRYAVVGDSAKSLENLILILERENSLEKIEAINRLIELSVLNVAEIEKGINWLQYEAFYNPSITDIEFIHIKKLVEIGKYDKALSIFEHYEENNPELGAGLVIQGSQVHKNAYLKGSIYEGLNQDQLAKENYQLYLAYHPDDELAPLAHLKLAQIRQRKGYNEAAMSHYKWLLGHEEDGNIKLQAYRGAAKIYFENGNFEEARRWASDAEKYDSDLGSSLEYGELAIVSLLKLGNLQDANAKIKQFESKYVDHPNLENSEARFLLEKGKFLSKMKNYRESADVYRRLIKKYPDAKYAADAKYELGRDYLELKKYDEALDILTAMPSEFPGHAVIGKVYWVLGNYYVSNGNVMDGISTYEKVLNDSTYKEVWPFVFLNQIRAYKQQGFYAGGLQTIQRYLELYPDAADSFDRKMDIGAMYQQLGQYDLAIAQFRKIQPLANVEDEAACQFYIAECLEKSGRLAEAVIEYKKVDYLGKRTKMQWAVTALYSAGRVLEKLGEEENAVEMYREIVKREGLASPFGRKAQEQILRIEKSKGE